MCEPDSAGTISDDDLTRLTNLFAEFEQAPDPLALACKEAEYEFNMLCEQLYEEKVKQNFGITFFKFRSFVRVMCRRRLQKEGGFLC